MNIKGAKQPMDLTDKVTVFVTTVGDRAYPHCIAALDAQDTRFRFEVLDRIAPMSAAFQTMVELCETPYYVQVDEDMILDPYAIRVLHSTMVNSTPNTAIVCYSLWDEHMRQSILGVKIYRHEIVKQFPYLNRAGCDVDLNERLAAVGYTVQSYWASQDRNPTCIGVHGRHYTPQTAYEAYYDRAIKSRLNPAGMGLMRWLPAEFRRRIADDPKDLVNLYALLGFEAGMAADITQGRAKNTPERDCRQVNHTFRRIQADLETFPIREASLHVTSRCNLSCTWCARQETTRSGSEEDMTAEMLDRLLAQCPTIQSVCIAGLGEPLLCSTLEELVATAKKRNLYVSLITNGVLLADYAKVLTAWGVDSLSVSLNSATAQSHQAITGSNTWDRVMAGLREAAEPFRFRDGKVRLAVSMVCDEAAAAEAAAFLDLAAKMDIRAVDYLTMLPSEGRKVSPIGDIRATVLTALEGHPETWRVRTWPVDMSSPCPGACISPYVSISMDAKGWLSPCRRVMAPGRRWGHIKGVYRPWQLPDTYKLKAGLEGDLPMPEPCSRCWANWRDK